MKWLAILINWMNLKKCYTLDRLGMWGVSRGIIVHYDGDDAARLKFKNINKNLEEEKDLNDKIEKDKFDFYIE